MKRTTSTVVAGLLAATATFAQAGSYTEDFEDPFVSWGSEWFGANSNARNFYCEGALGCDQRGNNPDGLWLSDSSGAREGSINIAFDRAFGARLVSFQLDVAAYEVSQLMAWDKDGTPTPIFNVDIDIFGDATSDPGVYRTYKIVSTNGISGFTFFGPTAGAVSVDNLVAITVPEPQTYALMLAGLAAIGAAARRRRG